MRIKQGRETITNQIAYIAGFFDGEGCVRLKECNKGKASFYVIAHLTNSYKPILEEVQSLFGGSIRMQERTPNKNIYNWCVCSSEAVDFLKVILHFLKEKRPQAELAIAFHKEKGKLAPEQKRTLAKRLSDMKREIIGNIYESPTRRQE